MLRNTGKSEIVFTFSFYPHIFVDKRKFLKNKERTKTLNVVEGTMNKSVEYNGITYIGLLED